MAYGNQEELIRRIKYNIDNAEDARPLALLVGSGLTAPHVPGVNHIVMSIRKALGESDRADFDDEINKQTDPGHKYQAAFSFMKRLMPPHMSDRVITSSTLGAYRPARTWENRPSAVKLADAERDVDGWNLTDGVAALGRIWAGLPTASRGPIITTNFDPLIEIAIQKAGASTFPRVMDSDGTFIHDITLSETSQIIHLHGFWRESQTLHMSTQLTIPRPALGGSLRALLSKYTLVVLGYSGWRDAVMMQLEAMIDEQSARDLDVLWCTFGDTASLDADLATNSALAKLTRSMGNVQFYTSIDANRAMPALEERLAGHLIYEGTSRRQSQTGNLLGWTPVTEIPPSRQDERNARARALDYFDGRIPTVRDGFNKYIPARDLVPSIINELKSNVIRKSNTFTLIVGASGEGKSTALIQIAARASKTPELRNVWIKTDDRVDSFVGVLNRSSLDEPLLLFIDDAHESISELRGLVTKLNQESLQRIHIVVATRDTDWAAVGGQTFAWQNYIAYKRHTIRGISRPDASAIVSSWELLGPPALGTLADRMDTEDRISYLLKVGQDEGLNHDGTLYGAMLATRYGDGLAEHIHQLMNRLRDRIFYAANLRRDMSLAEAFMYIAIPHSLGITTLDHSVLANLLGVSSGELQMNVLAPLGQESPIAIGGNYIVTRHRAIAETAVRYAPELNLPLRPLYERIVETAVEEIERRGLENQLHPLAYMSQSILDPDLKVATAEAATRTAPDRLSYRTSLSRAYRGADRADLGTKIGQESVALFANAADRQTGIRVSLTEWGVCEGQLDDAATNAFLAGLALADLSPDLDVNTAKIGGSLTCLGVAFERLWRDSKTIDFARGLSAVVYIGDFVELNESGHRQVENWKRQVVESMPPGSSPIESINTAIQALQRGVQQARNHAKPQSIQLLSSYQLRFDKLQRSLESIMGRSNRAHP